MITIKVRRGDDPTRAMQKLKNLVIREGLYKELKDRRYFAKPSKRKRLKREEAARTRVKDLRKQIARARKEEQEDSY